MKDKENECMPHCKDIAEIIDDYRYEERKAGELRIDINENHVKRWIEQFPQNQDIILRKTKKLLKNFYVSETDMYNLLKALARCEKLWRDPEDVMTNAFFLDCQTVGHSQHRLLDMIEKVIEELYDVQIKRTDKAVAGKATYIYIDDGLFSGKTLVQDMQSLILDIHQDSAIYAIFTVDYSFGDWWVHKQLDEKFNEKGIIFRTVYGIQLNNSNGEKYTFDCLRPTEYQSNALDKYIEILNEEHARNPDKKFYLFRDASLPKSPLFGAEEKRSILERELMDAGLKIYNFSQQKTEYIRPMGFDNRISLGFGAFFATFMNMANNCLLAYWWGDPSAEKWHPFSKWYPLLPRKAHINAGYCAW